MTTLDDLDRCVFAWRRPRDGAPVRCTELTHLHGPNHRNERAWVRVGAESDVVALSPSDVVRVVGGEVRPRVPKSPPPTGEPIRHGRARGVPAWVGYAGWGMLAAGILGQWAILIWLAAR